MAPVPVASARAEIWGDTATGLSPTHVALYTNGMTAAIKAFDAAEKAREAMKGE